MFLEERQLKVCEFLKTNGPATVQALSKKFDISLPTVRRDLNRLEKQNLITRTHGGAMIKTDVNNIFIDTSLPGRVRKFIKEKEEIAKYVVSNLIKPGDTIILDTGTTTFKIASLLRQYDIKGIKVITNSVRNALELSTCQGITHILVGGKLKPDVMAMVGPSAIKSLDGFHVDKAFIGISGLHWENGLTDVDPEEAQVKREFLKISKEKIVVADRSKFGETLFVKVCPISEINIIVTNSGLDSKLKEKFEKTGIDFIFV
jgi:DeoR family fructose operon transcriptional repressor